jgi:hypothetical protein
MSANVKTHSVKRIISRRSSTRGVICGAHDLRMGREKMMAEHAKRDGRSEMARDGSANKRYSWVRHKLSLAVHYLAVGPEDIMERLPRVYYPLADLSATDFPEALQADFEWVMSKLTAKKPRWTGPDFWETPAEASVAAMQSKTAAQIAKRIVYISERLQTIGMTREADG